MMAGQYEVILEQFRALGSLAQLIFLLLVPILFVPQLCVEVVVVVEQPVGAAAQAPAHWPLFNVPLWRLQP
jgi:hypothetical protein